MESELPKRIFREGEEPEVDKINNSCRLSILKSLEEHLPDEYNFVKRDAVFKHIVAIFENEMGYSGKVIHSTLCRQLHTEKMHELWFVFAKRPLRFSLQEYHAVTGLNCDQEHECNLEEWRNDNGFWSRLLKSGTPISLQDVRERHLKKAKDWRPIDKLRLAYFCVIYGVLFVKDEKTNVDHTYINLLMDLKKLRAYPWGLCSYKFLVNYINSTREHLYKPGSYSMHGFSFALQFWIMEAIPELGNMPGYKLIPDAIVFPRFSNWRGYGRIGYRHVRELEAKFETTGVLYSFISSTGNGDVVQSLEFKIEQDLDDACVDRLIAHIQVGKVWKDHIWEVHVPTQTVVPEAVEDGTESDMEIDEEFQTPISQCSTSRFRRGKKKFVDVGAVARKESVLRDRAAASAAVGNEDLKAFFTGMFQSGLASMKYELKSMWTESLESELGERLGPIHAEMKNLRDALAEANKPVKTIPVSSTPIASTSNMKKQSTSNNEKPPSAYQNMQTPTPQTKSYSQPPMFESNLFPVSLSQTEDIDMEMATQDFLNSTMKKMTQPSHVFGLNPTQESKDESESLSWLTPSSAVKPIKKEKKENKAEPSKKRPRGRPPKSAKKTGPSLSDEMWPPYVRSEPDNPLFFFKEQAWDKLHEWSLSEKKTSMQIGPTTFNKTVADRIILPDKWLATEDMDAVMYLYRQKTSMRRWPPSRVAFMSCSFQTMMNAAYMQYLKEKKKGFIIPEILLSYAKGDLPAHGKTGHMWYTDIDCIYVPLNVNGNHWVSLCISFQQRHIEIFDCNNSRHHSEVEAFKVLIPRILKAVLPADVGRNLRLTEYSSARVPMKDHLNTTFTHCGVYALSYIACHVLGLDFGLLNDDLIRGCRQKLAVDLFEAAHDPVLIKLMKEHEDPVVVADPEIVHIL